jgi:hypothetical protein
MACGVSIPVMIRAAKRDGRMQSSMTHRGLFCDPILAGATKDIKVIPVLAWYRFKVVLPNDHQSWAICLPRSLTSYQIFADGKLIGQFGGMPPLGQYVVGYDQLYVISARLFSSATPGHPISFAIRVWQWPRLPQGVSGGPTATTCAGHIDALKIQQTYEAWGKFWSAAPATC